MSVAPVLLPMDRLRNVLRRSAIWLFIATLAWTPFPLGGAIAWGAGLQEMLIAFCWILWIVATVGVRSEDWTSNLAIAPPLALAGLTLCWAIIQILPGVSEDWVHPVWNMASNGLGKHLRGVISLDPWRTEAEVLKLASYVMACWLAFRMSRRLETAQLLLNAVLVIGVCYVLFAIVLALAGRQQIDFFHSIPHVAGDFSGPFVSRNNFATYMGLMCVVATARLFTMANGQVSARRGIRRFGISILNFCIGRGTPSILAVILCFAAVVMSASRAGFASMLCGLGLLALALLLKKNSRSSTLWSGVGSLAVVLPILFLVVFSGDTLADRLMPLFDTGTADSTRLALWDATWRMIRGSPLLGLGLGTFQDAYPLYASRVFPYVMDRAHCDYLEFAAGIGVPAAIAWWGAIIWIFALCVRGVRVRRRNHIFCLTASAATAVVAVHSCFDFSLQLPAIALVYATLMGIGAAQSMRTRS